jgi:hypothetical protein
MTFASYLDPSRRDESRRCGGLGRLGRLRRTLPPAAAGGLRCASAQGVPHTPGFPVEPGGSHELPGAPSPLPSLRLPSLSDIARRRAELLATQAGETPGRSGAAARCNPVNAPVRARMRGLRHQALSRAPAADRIAHPALLRQIPLRKSAAWPRLDARPRCGRVAGRRHADLRRSRWCGRDRRRDLYWRRHFATLACTE